MTTREIDFRDSNKVIIANIKKIDDKNEIIGMNDIVFRWLIQQKEFDLFKKLIVKFNPDTKMMTGGIVSSILSSAPDKENLEMLQYLVDKGFRVEASFLNLIAKDYNEPMFKIMIGSKYLRKQISHMRDKDFVKKVMYQDKKDKVGVFADLME